MSTKKDVSKKSTTVQKKRTSDKNLSNKESPEEVTNKTKELQKKSIPKKSTEEKLINSLKTSSESKSKASIRTPRSSVTNLKDKTKSSNRDVPLTPPSTRVKKTQYFPTKNLYSNALKTIQDVQSKPLSESASKSNSSTNIRNKKEPDRTATKLINNSDRNKSRDSFRKKLESSKINNSKSKKLISEKSKKLDIVTPKTITRNSSPESSSISERPRTATLRKGSIVNSNIVGPDAPIAIKTISKKDKIKETAVEVEERLPSPSVSSSENYEDDFESYESDFEAYSSSENSSYLGIASKAETSSMSSSAGDLSDNNENFLTTQTDTKRSSSAGTDDERKLDSGTFELPEFKHKQILEHIKENIEKESSNLVNDRVKEKTNLSSLPDEGFEEQKSLQFINFADAKKRYDRRKASIVRKKRGEEILNMIKLNTVNFTLLDLVAVPYDEFIKTYGRSNTVQTSSQTGDDNISEETQTVTVLLETKWTQMPVSFSTFDTNREHFWINYRDEFLGVGYGNNEMKKCEDKIQSYNESRLNLFLNKAADVVSELIMEENMKSLENVLKNQRELPFSDGYIEFNTSDKVLEDTRLVNMSIFNSNVRKILTVHLKTKNRDNLKSIICIWDLSDVEEPKTILNSYGEVSCAIFSTLDCSYIFAGQRDGTVLIWDTKERNRFSKMLSGTPIFTTTIGSSHLSKVVTIYCIDTNDKNKNGPNSSQSNEVCSLAEEGDLIIWNLYIDVDNKRSRNDVSLIKIIAINLQDQYPELPDMLCTDLLIQNGYAYISTNYGFILHCALDEVKHNVQKYSNDSKSTAICLEACPFSSSYFLTGCDNGSLALYSKISEKPLMVLRNSDELDNISIQIVRWSTSMPFVLYAKDSKNTVHIWNLGKSDMFPEYSIPFKDDISCLKLSPVVDIESRSLSYMIIGTSGGKIHLHILNKEYSQQDFNTNKENMKIFFNYVNRL